MEDRQTLAYGFVDEVYVIIHLEDRVEEPEWQACLREAMHAPHASRLLLVAGTLMPDVGQRTDLATLHEKHGTKVAVLSDSPTSGRVVTALKWSGIEAEAFGMDDLDGVLVFFNRSSMRARLSSALGPYLDRSWQHDPTMLSASLDRSRVADTLT